MTRKPVLTTFNEVKSVFSLEQRKKLSKYLKGEHEKEIRYSKIIDALGLTWGLDCLQIYDDGVLCRGHTRWHIFVFVMKVISRAAEFYVPKGTTTWGEEAKNNFQAALCELTNLNSTLPKEDYLRFVRRILRHCLIATANGREHKCCAKGRKSQLSNYLTEEYIFQTKLFKEVFL